MKVCAARLKSPDPRINLSFKRRVWNRLCGFPHRLTQRCTVGNRGEGGGRGKKVTFPELILIRGFRQTKCFDLAALQATSHSRHASPKAPRWHFPKKWTARLAPRRDGRGQGERRATGKWMRGYRCVPADAFEPVHQRLVDGGWQKCTRTVSLKLAVRVSFSLTVRHSSVYSFSDDIFFNYEQWNTETVLAS